MDLTQRWPAGQPLVDIVGMVVAKMTVAVVGVVSPGKLAASEPDVAENRGMEERIGFEGQLTLNFFLPVLSIDQTTNSFMSY